MALTATADETAIRDITTQLQSKLEGRSQVNAIFQLAQPKLHSTATRVGPRIKSDWLSDKYKIVIATVTSILTESQPFVIHHSLPSKDMDGYYQEMGHEVGVMVFSWTAFFDLIGRSSMVQNDSEKSAEEKERQTAALRAVAIYCLNGVECRRTMVLRHFGEKFDPANCHKQCDNCRKDGASVTQDLTAYAQRVIELHKQMSATGSMIATGTLKAVFKGRNIKAVREGGHQQLSLCGAGKDLDAAILDRLIDYMLHNTSILRIERVARGQWTQNYVELGDQADACVKGRLQVCLAFRDEDIGSANQSYSGSSIGRQWPAKTPASANEELVQLRKLHPKFALQKGVNCEGIFEDFILDSMAKFVQNVRVFSGYSSAGTYDSSAIDELRGLLSTLCPNEEEVLVKLDRYGKGFVRIFAHGSR
ncbi:hypothetical protein CONPUDRAFT_77682 [Coniophora puteana RWD-64-598 SS2]|uniref:RQC domain-containing protein n=1 Tax=Coniophora puteana (strain RWD-64-598) TaxID=741705 RepID=A0A5M3M6Y1_CONPW|nr:uncharacterized protein CONPUDRAFT_77682 [Coniophora puteana RWD-64-598 SS2]EIW74867.1 hypothetical protein CONPUDRAFT_77682 [Coniophora puteana RWD-64-598 SS2]